MFPFNPTREVTYSFDFSLLVPLTVVLHRKPRMKGFKMESAERMVKFAIAVLHILSLFHLIKRDFTVKRLL